MPPPPAIIRRFNDLSDSAPHDFDFSWDPVGYGTLTWSQLLESPRVLIMSEAGAGKTFECQAEQRRRWERGDPAFWVELAALAAGELSSTMSAEELRRFNAWLSDSSSIATFFLDSVDELLLTKATFEQALKAVSRGIGMRHARTRIVVTSRPTDFDRTALTTILPFPDRKETDAINHEPGQGFIDAAMGRRATVRRSDKPASAPSMRCVSLVPLTVEEIQNFVAGKGVSDSERFTEALIKKNALSFARRPQDLIELVNDWKVHGSLRSHREQVSLNVAVKLKGASRRKERDLPRDKAVAGARTLALSMLLTRRFVLRHGADSDTEDGLDAVLDPTELLVNWSPEEIKALMERPLFGHAGYGRVRFHHRSVIEFLAAEQLAELLQNGARLRDVMALLFATTPQGMDVIKPNMRPTTIWLAGRHGAVLEEVLRRQPEALLQYGDPESLSERERLRALLAYVERVSGRQREGTDFAPEQVQRIACHEVLAALPALWQAGIANPDVRELFLQLFEALPTSDGSDIAFRVLTDPQANLIERGLAADVLVTSNDARLPVIADTLVHDQAAWPDDAATAIALRLIPKHLHPQQLSLLLDRLSPMPNAPGRDLGPILARYVTGGRFDSAFLTVLRDGVTATIVAGMDWSSSEYPRYRTRRSDLVELLAAICARQLAGEAPVSVALLCAAIVAVQVSKQDHVRDSAAAKIRDDACAWPPALRCTAFIAGHALLQGIHPISDAWDRLSASYESGLIRLDPKLDAYWALEIIADRGQPAPLRATLLESTLSGLVPPKTTRPAHLKRLRQAVADQSNLLTRLEQAMAAPKETPELKRMRAQDARRNAAYAKKEAERRAGWSKFTKEVREHPDRAFSDTRINTTAWDLWQVMRGAGDTGVESGWNRPFLEREFGVDIANRLKQALRPIWRRDRPTLPHERPADQRNVTLVRWGMGNTALSAEAEDAGWAARLSAQEAALASCYVPIELNRFPAWLPDLAAAHPEPVRVILMQLIDDELRHVHDPKCHPLTLQHLEYADETIQALVLPHLAVWLQANAEDVSHRSTSANPTYGLERVIRLLLKHGSSQAQAMLKEISLNAFAGPVSSGWELLWFSTLFTIDPTSATQHLEQQLKHYAINELGEGARLLGGLFGDRHEALRINPRDRSFSPELRLRLTRLAYAHVRRQDDVEHLGSYTQDDRDAAEHARGALLGALLDADGPGAWDAKMALANDPIIGEFADRARAITAEHEASASEGDALVAKQVQAVLAGIATPPMNRDQMFALLEHRLDDLEDLLRTDTSPRETWSRVTEEREMRRLIGHELETMARGTYIVDQEPVSAEEKEMDIRLVSTASPETGVIELKVGNERSGSDLRDTIQHQLVGKYLRPDRRKAGCLLVTVGRDRSWKHPDTGERLDIDGLRFLLAEEALRVERALYRSVRITTRVLDLRPPLPIERLNKRATAKKPQRKASKR
jgi:hypothetical protein